MSLTEVTLNLVPCAHLISDDLDFRREPLTEVFVVVIFLVEIGDDIELLSVLLNDGISFGFVEGGANLIAGWDADIWVNITAGVMGDCLLNIHGWV